MAAAACRSPAPDADTCERAAKGRAAVGSAAASPDRQWPTAEQLLPPLDVTRSAVRMPPPSAVKKKEYQIQCHLQGFLQENM